MADRLDDETLAELQRLNDAATPGPWKVWAMDVLADPVGDSNLDTALLIARTSDPHRGLRTFNADLIAAARSAVPSLLAEVALLRATIERVAEAGAEWMRVNDDISVMDDGFNSVIPHADYSALIVAEERLQAALAALGPAGADRQEQP